MSQTFRHPEIVDIARRDGKVTVDGLARHFGVTLQTIRRDLCDLDRSGTLARVHGGAILASGSANIHYAARRDLHRLAKDRMAQACAARIPDGATLFLGIGTSTEAVARRIVTHRAMIVVTNNLNIANILAEDSDCDVIVAGGGLRRSDWGLMGQVTLDVVRQFKFDIAVLGCSALDADGDVLDFDAQEVEVNRNVNAAARVNMLLADSSKFARTAPVRVFSLADQDTVFTDQPLPGDLAARCDGWGVEIVCCDGR